MRSLPLVLIAALIAFGCTEAQQPSAPPAPPTNPALSTDPTHIQLLVSSRTDQRMDVTAQVLSANGTGVPNIKVQFGVGAGAGVVDPLIVTTDATGTAKTIALTTAPTTITATIGGSVNASFNATIPSATALSVSLSAPSVTIGSVSTLSVSANSQPIGGPFAYVWDFGDGATATGSASSTGHTYAKVGSYPANVRVTDGAGRTATGTASVVVNDVASSSGGSSSTTTPTLNVTLACTAQSAHNTPSTPSPCNVSATYTNASGTTIAIASDKITSVTWDWGDGTVATVTGSPLSSHNYTQAGTFIVTPTVTATTSDGAKTASANTKLTIS